MITDLEREFLAQSACAHRVGFGPDERVVSCNRAMADLLGWPAPELAGRPARELLTRPDLELMRARARTAPGDVRARLLLNFVDRRQRVHSLWCHMLAGPGGVTILAEPTVSQDRALRAQLASLTNELSLLARDSARQARALARANQERQRALERLERSYWHLQKIQEVLPICMDCGRVQTAEASWREVVDFLREHAPFLSHGLCPECAARRRVARGIDAGREETP